MASDDFEVVAFKILSYLYRCMKNGKKVDIASLRQLVGCNEAYFGAVARSLQSKGYVDGFAFDAFSGVVIDSPNIAAMSDPMITMDGAIFVSENSRMRKAKDFGIIPACAGNTWRSSTAPRTRRDHPRVCGEHSNSSRAEPHRCPGR